MCSGSPVKTVQYVVYIRFCGGRHVTVIISFDEYRSDSMAPQRLQVQSCHWLVRELAVASDDDMRAAVGSLWCALSANSHTYYYLYSITHSLFLSRLKTSIFCKSFPPQPFFFLLQDSLHGFSRLLTVIS